MGLTAVLVCVNVVLVRQEQLKRGNKMWDISAYDEAEFTNGNRATPENDSYNGCEGEFCPDGTCRVCRYTGPGVNSAAFEIR